MIITPRDTRYSPDINVIVTKTATKITGDGVFEDSDLVRIPYDGYLLVNAVSDTGGNTCAVPYIHHQENRWNYIPKNNTGLIPDWLQVPAYKIPVHKGDTPRILYTDAGTTNSTFQGCFFRGMNRRSINNPVAYNTPDVMVIDVTSATEQNILEGTDLEDFPMPGVLCVWATAAGGQDNTIQIMQKGHQTGNTSIIPTSGDGYPVNCGDVAPYKMYVPATGNPTVTITNSGTDVITVVACLYVDWANVSPSLRARMGY